MTAPHEGARGPAATGPGAQGTTDAAHSASQADDAQRKADATRIARAALAGIELVRLADGTWMASRWGLMKALGADEVDAWLARVGAPA